MSAYLELFWAFFQVGLFSIGGGYAAIGVIEQQAVHHYGWITQTEYIDLITIAEMTPGPITLNSATFVGIRVAGLPGAILATFASILPAIFIVSALAYLYFKYQELSMVQGVLAGLRPAVVAIIGAAGLNIIHQALWGGAPLFASSVSATVANMAHIDFVAAALFIIAMIVLTKFKPNPIFVMLGCGVVGGAAYLLIS